MKHYFNRWIIGLRMLAAVLISLACIITGLRLLSGFECFSVSAGFNHLYVWGAVDILFVLIIFPLLVTWSGRAMNCATRTQNKDS
jgi:hypothetical protein